jgi:hypothetical protein
VWRPARAASAAAEAAPQARPGARDAVAARALEAQPAGGADSVVPAIEASMASYWLALGGGARGERHQAADVTWVYTGRPVLNRVVGAAFESTVAAARVRDVVAQFAVRNAPVTWLVGPSTRPPHLERHLQVQAFEHAGSWTGMALDLTRATREGSAPPGLRLLAVADAATRSQWLQVVAAGFGLPRSAREVMAELAARPAAPGVDGALLTHFAAAGPGHRHHAPPAGGGPGARVPAGGTASDWGRTGAVSRARVPGALRDRAVPLDAAGGAWRVAPSPAPARAPCGAGGGPNRTRAARANRGSVPPAAGPGVKGR